MKLSFCTIFVFIFAVVFTKDDDKKQPVEKDLQKLDTEILITETEGKENDEDEDGYKVAKKKKADQNEDINEGEMENHKADVRVEKKKDCNVKKTRKKMIVNRRREDEDEDEDEEDGEEEDEEEEIIRRPKHKYSRNKYRINRKYGQNGAKRHRKHGSRNRYEGFLTNRRTSIYHYNDEEDNNEPSDIVRYSTKHLTKLHRPMRSPKHTVLTRKEYEELDDEEPESDERGTEDGEDGDHADGVQKPTSTKHLLTEKAPAKKTKPSATEAKSTTGRCMDVFESRRCMRYSMQGLCFSNMHALYMQNNCKRTCGFCHCEDKAGDCQKYVPVQCNNATLKAILVEWCQLSCGFCHCVDQARDCNNHKHECATNVEVQQRCKITCNTC